MLFTSWLIFRGIGAVGVTAFATWQGSARYALAVMFVFTGIAHFNKMRYDLAQMIPSIFPQKMLLVYITGVLEFLGALGLTAAKGSHSSRNMSDSFARSNVHRQCKRGVEKSDPARQARNRPLATHSHADSIHRLAVVVNPNLNK